jgi:hypothetical protein
MQLNDDDLKQLWQQDTVAPDQRAECLSADFLVRAGEGKLSADERARVTSHLAHCADCAEEYRIARSTQEWAAQAAARHPEAFPVTNAQQITTSESWWRRLLQPLMLPPMLTAGAVLSALLLLVMGWLAWQSLSKKEVKPEIAETTPTPVLTPSASPLATATPTEATLIAQLNDGQTLVTLDEQGRLAGVDNLSPAYQQMVKEALTTRHVERSPLLTGLGQQAGSLRGGDEQGNTFALLGPVGKVVLSDRPVFRWSSLAGATGYVVEIYDDQFNLVSASPQLTATSWTASQPLKRDKIYSWQVKASKDGQEFKAPGTTASQATFRVLGQTKANELAQARRAYASSHLTLGLLYAQAGLIEEAEAEFRALQKANPQSDVARRLLANVRTMRR